MGLVDDDICKYAARQLLVQLGGGEIHVAGHQLSGLDHDAAEYVFRSPSLVGRNDVLVTGNVPEIGDQSLVGSAVTRRRPGGFIGGPLVGAHGRGAGIGQQVYADVCRAQQKSVVTGSPDSLLALEPAQRPDSLNCVDLVGKGVELKGSEIRQDTPILHLVAPLAAGADLHGLDPVTLLVEIDDCVGHLVELLVGHGQPWDLHRHEIVTANAAMSDRPYPRGLIQGRGEGVLRVVLDAWQKPAGFDICAVAAPLQGHAALSQPQGEALGLLHDPMDLGLVAHFGKTPCQHFHGATRHAAVGVQAFIDHHLVHQLLVVVGVVGSEDAAVVALGVLGAVNLEDAAGLGDLHDDIGNRAVRAAGLVLLDVPGVLDHP